MLRFEVLEEPVTRPVELGPGLSAYPVPVPDFALHRAVVTADRPAVRLPGGGPRIVLCTRGTVRVDDGVVPVTLTQGQAAFAPAPRPGLSLSGAGEAYQAATP